MAHGRRTAGGGDNLHETIKVIEAKTGRPGPMTSNPSPSPPSLDSAPSEPLIKMLENMLDQAKSGKLKGAVVLMVQGPNTMGPVMAPADRWMAEYYCAAGMLMSRLELMWHEQIVQQMGQVQTQAAQHRRGVMPVPANALDGLPKDFFKKGR